MKITLKDIAAYAGLSTSAVSQILNDRPVRVSDKKRQLVLSYAREVGYIKQNPFSSVKNDRPCFALIVPTLHDKYYSSQAGFVFSACDALDCSLRIYHSNFSRQRDLHNLETALRDKADGVIFFPSIEVTSGPAPHSPFQYFEKYIELFQGNFVIAEHVYPSLACNYVNSNHYWAGYLAASYLLEHGHRQIGFITGRQSRLTPIERLSGIQNAFWERNLTFDSSNIFYCDYTQPNHSDPATFSHICELNAGYQFVSELLNRKLTAVITHNGTVAQGLLTRVRTDRLNIPDEFSIISFDYAQNAALSYELSVTRVERPIQEIAQAAVQILYDRLTSENKFVTKIFQPEIIEGDTVRTI